MGKNSRLKEREAGVRADVNMKNSAASVSPPAEQLSTRFLTRNKILTLLGIGTVAGLVFLRQPESHPLPSSIPAATAETAASKELMLGNVRFYLRDANSLSTEEQSRLFTNMRSAYKKLEDYFGADMLIMRSARDCPIIINRNSGQSEVVRDGKLTIGTDGRPFVIAEPDIVLKIAGNLEESAIAHEFVHLFLQAPGFFSQLFNAGQAEAMEVILYGKIALMEGMEQLLAEEKIGNVLDRGLDFTYFDSDIQGGGSKGLLNDLTVAKWSLDWIRLEERDPGFLKKFYEEIARRKRQGKISFSKEELLAVAQNVSPHFALWYKSSKSFQEIGQDHAPRQVFEAIRLPKMNMMVVANFGVIPRVIQANPDNTFKITPPCICPMNDAILRVSFLNPNTGLPEIVVVPQTDPTLSSIAHLPREILYAPSLKVTYDTVEVPLVN